MRWKLFILFTAGTILLSPSNFALAQEAQTPDTPAIETRPDGFPNRINITVRISAHEDLKIAKNMVLEKGQVISDRVSERSRLEAQKKQLELSLKRVQSASIQEPSKPLPVPSVAPLPPVNYLEYEAAIAKAELSLESASKEVEIKNQEIAELSKIPKLDPILIKHQQAKLKQLELKYQIAESELELARGKLETAKQQRKLTEYEFSVTAARRVEEQNQASSFFQRQLAEYNEKVSDKEIQIIQLQEKINNVQTAIASLQIVSPYAGEVRSIDFLGQSEDGSITVKILLRVAKSTMLEQ